MTPEHLDKIEAYALRKLAACIEETTAKFIQDLADAGHGEDEIKALLARQKTELDRWISDQVKNVRPWITSAAYGFDVHDLA